ncbi:alpha-1,2-fucosyltransferase [Mucilaginibacter sp. Bleaf8]|uniref:alpha-1,2-fucosyltransferase n=1 Tax=Mucilaginibacter sp. Bleaf8 TaxID=2834430 RepID=UPI001BCE3261|nr:alpha-1,2-fucosyltransferase [Mucilaginibacter sp. Bleaf8]MBS7566818.1 alpha-1,2-fucosyltransferase [Mucilaginibacter sp. Bleaf8]
MIKTIYYLPNFGQLGNQMAILAHLMAFASKYNYQIIYPYSPRLKRCLDEEQIGKANVFFSKILSNKLLSSFLIKLIKYVCAHKNFQFLDILMVNTRFVVDEQAAGKVFPSTIIITDWMFRFYAGVEEQQKDIKTWLSFDKQHTNRPQSFIQKINQDFAPAAIVGVHVRHGDYATWHGGKFFYDANTYYAKMQQIAAQMPDCVFVVCSNENIVFENTAGLNIVHAKGSDIEDLCVLAHCDYIIGPPSTFSGWAAFLGSRPIFFLQTKEDTVAVDKFFTYQV